MTPIPIYHRTTSFPADPCHPDHIAFFARVTDGNHNNALLIDRAYDQAAYWLAVLRSEVSCAVRDIGDACGDALRDDARTV